MAEDQDNGFVIFSGNKLWYTSKEGIENTICKQKNTKTISKVRNAAKNKRVVEHPIFDEIMNNEVDPFWISFFNEFAIGKLPRNFKYQNGVLIHRVKSKNIELAVPSDPEEAVIIIKKFVFETGGIISPTDLNEKKMNEEKRISEMLDNETISWNSIRGEKQQSILISLYVENIGKYYKLTISERKSLIQLIKIGVLAGYFTSDNIKLIGNQIVEIGGLEYNEVDRVFSINKESCKVCKIPKKTYEKTTAISACDDDSEISKQSNKNIFKLWNRFLRDIDKKFTI